MIVENNTCRNCKHWHPNVHNWDKSNWKENDSSWNMDCLNPKLKDTLDIELEVYRDSLAYVKAIAVPMTFGCIFFEE